jgi:hypothetical protein
LDRTCIVSLGVLGCSATFEGSLASGSNYLDSSFLAHGMFPKVASSAVLE